MARILLWLLVNCCSVILFAQTKQQIQVDVVYLSSDLLEGRETGSVGERMAADYIEHRFKNIGLKTLPNQSEYRQNFTFKTLANPKNPHDTTAGKSLHGQNVIGFLDNQALNTIIIGAHYDHLGLGSHGSLYTGEPAIHNGADDNASGVSSLLYLAEKLSKSNYKASNYCFIAFSGEEYGLHGSKSFTEKLLNSVSGFNFMINMDMVGRLNGEKSLVINGVGTSPAWKELLEKYKGDLKLATTESGIGPSDHTSFYLKDRPVLHFFTGQHTDYHKPGDDSHLINYQGIEQISEFIYQLVTTDSNQGSIAFTKTKDDEGRKAAQFKVSLGVMPDYTYTDSGMRVDGVIDGRPGQVAGMQKGDIITKLGNLDIKDIYAYMEALSKFKPGDSTEMRLKRDGQEMILQVKF